MTDTATLAGPNAGHGTPFRASDCLMNLIVAFLAPMFLGITAGDLRLARLAAIETVEGYRAREHGDLFAVAQLIGFSIAALGSLSLSLSDDISVILALRLRTNASAMNRAAELNRRVLRDSRDEQLGAGGLPAGADSGEDMYEEAVLAGVDAARKAALDAAACPDAGDRPATVVAPAPRAPVVVVPVVTAVSSVKIAPVMSPPLADARVRAGWAASMTKIAAEFTTGLANLPPAERRAASIKAAALTSTAHDLLSGEPIPRPTAGDLAALMRPNPVRR